MDTSYLPTILDHTLKIYTDEFGLTSWKIVGGKSHNATVILRFGMGNLGQQHQEHQITYRRKLPSALERDRQRLGQHRINVNDQDSYQGSLQHVNIDSITEFTPGAAVHGCPQKPTTPPLPSLPQVDGVCDSAGSKASTFVDIKCMNEIAEPRPLDAPSSGNVEMELTDSTHSSLDNLIKLELGCETSEIMNRDVKDSSDTLVISNSDLSDDSATSMASGNKAHDDGIKCRHCSCVLGEKDKEWYKCTDCSDAWSHYDLCKACHSHGVHIDHTDAMMNFNIPPDEDDDYCDSCGYQFRTNDRMYECIKCRDEPQGKFVFEMCRQCYNKGLHSAHQPHLRRCRGRIS